MNDLDYKKLIEEGKRYFSFEWDYTKLTAVEKLAVLLSSIAFVTLVGLFAVFILFYVISVLVDVLTIWTGASWIADMIVALLLALVLWAIVSMKKQLIINPITRFVTKLFLNPNDHE